VRTPNKVDGATLDDARADLAETSEDRADAAGDVVDAPETCAPGQTRPCYDGPVGTLGVGLCAAGAERCGLGGWSGTCEGAIRPAIERCDGVDNNCNGAVDEALTPRSCGIGMCVRTIPACVDGRPNPATCTPLPGGTEVCNGLDDDCDGAVDESLPAVICGVGACSNTVYCTRGAYPACVPGAPEVERCDGLDNNCDGRVDEGLPVGARCRDPRDFALFGSGACSYGAFVCSGREWTCVTPVSAQPQSERCNGLDDDCDGVTDEGYASSCVATVGACARPGTQRCRADGSRYCDGGGDVTPSTEVCNGIDDDCNGLTDEGGAALATAPCTVGLGTCQRTGVFRCASGSARCDAVPGMPAEDTCDGVDNDCDGYIDNGFVSLGTRCDVVHPWCERHGMAMCLRGVGVVCEGRNQSPVRDRIELDEVCNGRDDNCNGLVDEIPERLPDGSERPCPRVP